MLSFAYYLILVYSRKTLHELSKIFVKVPLHHRNLKIWTLVVLYLLSTCNCCIDADGKMCSHVKTVFSLIG